MANDESPTARAGGTGRRCSGSTLARADLVTFLLAAALCSASYCLGVWHNSRGAADSRVLGPSAAVVAAGTTYCGGGDADEPLDFGARHAAEDAGLSVSTSSAKTTTKRRALRGAADGSTAHRGVALAGRRWAAPARVDGGSFVSVPVQA